VVAQRREKFVEQISVSHADLDDLETRANGQTRCTAELLNRRLDLFFG